MSLVVVGLNHRAVPLELLERMAVPPERLPKALHALTRREHLAEVVLLSTCNRTEVYAQATMFHPAMQDVRDFLADTSGVAPEEFSDVVYAYHDDAAVAHLFGVAAGLDSMIIGEGEILGQVREAWHAAELEQACGPALSRTFRHAVEVGKRARTETGIARHAVSVSSAAVTMAAATLGSLHNRKVLVVGAGEMGQGAVLALSEAGVGEIVVANRTVASAEALAARVSGRAISLAEVPDAIVACDLLLVSTTASEVLVERGMIETAMARRDGRALLVVDIGVPRNVDPGAGEVFGVTLLDIDSLRAVGEQSLAQRRREIGKVRDIVAAELERHRAERSAREAAPLVTALRARADAMRAAEMERLRTRGLDDTALKAADAAMRSLVNKLLHDPTVKVKDAAGTARGDLYADALAELFGLTDVDPEVTGPPVRVATRASALAQWQARRVAELLGADVELVLVTTTGDSRRDTPIHAMGGTGVFVKEVQLAVLDGRADVAVHSAKDLPASTVADGALPLVLGAVPERADPRDALVGSTLESLPAGATVATGSVRRRAQLAALRPDIRFAELRGNIPTRLERAAEFDAIVVAAAALERLGLLDLATELLEPDVMMPQVGQGALAVECRADDAATRERLAAIDDVARHRQLDAERAFLAQLGSGCMLPCGALATCTGDTVDIRGVLASADGTVLLRGRSRGDDPAGTGTALADDLLSRGGHALVSHGAGS